MSNNPYIPDPEITIKMKATDAAMLVTMCGLAMAPIKKIIDAKDSDKQSAEQLYESMDRIKTIVINAAARRGKWSNPQ